MENFRSQIVLEVRILLPTGLFACCWQDPFLIRILLRTEFTKSNPLQQDQNMKSLEAFIIPTHVAIFKAGFKSQILFLLRTDPLFDSHGRQQGTWREPSPPILP